MEKGKAEEDEPTVMNGQAAAVVGDLPIETPGTGK